MERTLFYSKHIRAKIKELNADYKKSLKNGVEFKDIKKIFLQIKHLSELYNGHHGSASN